MSIDRFNTLCKQVDAKAETLISKKVALAALREQFAREDSEENEPHKARILVIDDDPRLCRVVQQTLSDLYSVDVAHDAQEALVMTRERLYDVLLIDVSLPQVDGLRLLKRLQHRPKSIAMSGIHAATLESRAREARADAILVKPFDAEHLKAAIAGVLP